MKKLISLLLLIVIAMAAFSEPFTNQKDFFRGEWSYLVNEEEKTVEFTYFGKLNMAKFSSSADIYQYTIRIYPDGSKVLEFYSNRTGVIQYSYLIKLVSKYQIELYDYSIKENITPIILRKIKISP